MFRRHNFSSDDESDNDGNNYRSKEKSSHVETRPTFYDSVDEEVSPEKQLEKPIFPKYAATNHSNIEEEILIDEDETILDDHNEINNSDDDWLTDDDIETSNVIINLNGFVDEESIVERIQKGLCRVRHSTTDHPIVQLEGQLFTGKYLENNGSIMIMQRDTESNESYKLFGTSTTVLEARKCYIFAKGNKTN